MKLELEKGFTRKLSKRIEGYNFEVGILDDKAHFAPSFGPTSQLAKKSKPALTTFAGGPARKIFRGRKSTKTTGQIAVANMQRLGINFLLEPFKDRSSDIMKFTKEFLRMAIAKTSPRRVENLLQAVVRNPILRGEYGNNSRRTIQRKGFNRLLIDTAQMFKAIKARVKRV